MASADISSLTLAPPARSTPDASVTLQANLARLASRRNVVALWLSIARALSWGLGAAALIVLAYRFYLVDGPIWVPAIPIVLSILVGWRIGNMARYDTFEAALEADEKLGLKEHLSSALAFAQPDAVRRAATTKSAIGVLPKLSSLFSSRAVASSSVSTPASTGLVPSLVEDAAHRSQSLEPKSLYPVAFDRTHRVLLLSAAMFAITLFMPNVPWLLAAGEQASRKTIAAQGKDLVEVAKEIKKDEAKTPQSEAARPAQTLEARGQKMLRGRLGKKEALTGLGELKKDLEKAAKNDGQNQNSVAGQEQMQAALEQIAKQPMDSEAGKQIQEKLKNGDKEAAAKEMEKLADKLDKGEMSPEEQKKAADDLNKMAKSLKQQGGDKNQKMADQLEQAAKSLQQQAKQQQAQQQGKQSPSNQKQSGQQQQQGNQQGQKNQQQKGQGQNSQQGGQSQQQKGGNSGASSALRQMAKGARQGNSSNSQNLQKMLDKVRQAEQGTGNNPGGQSGQGQNGSGKSGSGQAGQGGKTMTPGKDLKSSDPHGAVSGGAGLGPRNNAKGSLSGGGVSDIRSKRTSDKRRWADVWSDRVPATRKKIDRIQGKYGDEGETEQLPTQQEAKGGPVKTPYYEVYESYKKDAEDAVNKETVPPAYKQPVKEYFESIKP